MVCFNCYGEGHAARDCPNPTVCNACGGKGHKAAAPECPKGKGKRGSSGKGGAKGGGKSGWYSQASNKGKGKGRYDQQGRWVNELEDHDWLTEGASNAMSL